MSIERLARAAREASVKAGRPKGSHLSSQPVSEQFAADIVRAILLALREPDEGMVEAGARKIYAPDDLDDLARQVAEEAFTAAIDSILNGDARP